MLETALVIAAYLIGSVSSAIIVCAALGLPDPRTVGSNNPGATNVLRIGGKKAAGLTLAGDMLKGVLPVLAGHALGLTETSLIVVGFAAFIGHLYPVFFGFHGGKGVATALGVYIALNPMLGGAVALTWLVVAKGFKLSSLSALIATALAPLYALFMGMEKSTIGVILLLTLILWWRHRSNIQRLVSGEESAIGKAKKEADQSD